jgi:hypothetical protein
MRRRQVQFNSAIYADGLPLRRPSRTLSARGYDFYVRIGRWFGPDVLVSIEFDQSKIGLVTAGG